jgi:cytochrome P450
MGIIDELEGEFKAIVSRVEDIAKHIESRLGQKFQTALQNEPLGVFALLRSLQPILETKNFTLLTRFDDVEEVLSRNAVFTVKPYVPKMDPSLGVFMLDRDDTVYNQRDKGIMRALIQQSDMEAVGALASKLARDEITRARGASFDVVENLSRKVPVLVTGGYFGFPGPDMETMLHWSYWTQYDMFHNITDNAIVHAHSIDAGQSMHRYVLEDLLPSQTKKIQASPDVFDDIVSRLIKLKTPDSIGFDVLRRVVNICGLLVGGVETSSAAVVQSLNQLFDRPEQLAKAQAAAHANDLSIVYRYWREALRFQPINPFVLRRSVQDYTVAASQSRSHLVKAGSLVLASTASAMHDESVVPSPSVFDIERPDYHYLHYGYGHHLCLGNQVADKQCAAIVMELLKQPGLRRVSSSKLDWTPPRWDDSGLLPGPFPGKFLVSWDGLK